MKQLKSLIGWLIVAIIWAVPARAEEIGFTVQVINGQEKPLTGATVEFYRRDASHTPISGDIKLFASRVVGGDGTVSMVVEPQEMLALVRQPGLATAWRSWWQGERGGQALTLALGPPTTVEGAVVDAQGNPVADAEVFAEAALCQFPIRNGGSSFSYLSRQMARELFSTRTDAWGNFRLAGVATNAFLDLSVYKPGLTLRRPPRDGLGPDTVIGKAGKKDIQLVLEPASAIEGQVKMDGPAWAVTNMTVWVVSRDSRNYWTSDRVPVAADGSFRLGELAAHTYMVHSQFGKEPMPPLVADSVEVQVGADETVRDVVVNANPGGVLVVEVKDKTKPLPGTKVAAYKDTYNQQSLTDSNGVAWLRVPPEEYVINLSCPRYQSGSVKAIVQAGVTNRIVSPLEPLPKVTGQVLDPEGKPVAGLPLFKMPDELSPSGLRTDASGKFEFDWQITRRGVGGEMCCLIALDTNRNLGASIPIEDSGEVTVRLAPCWVVSGVVHDPEGKPISGAKVQYYQNFGPYGRQCYVPGIFTDSQGRFESSGFAPGGKYSAWASAKGHGSANLHFPEMGATHRADLGILVLATASQKLSGMVVDNDDQPVAEVKVHLSGTGQPSPCQATTDAEGRFAFNAICEGNVSLFASQMRQHGSARAQAGSTDVLIILGKSDSAEGRSVSPVPRTLKGQPLPDLAPFGLAKDSVPVGKPVLLCLFDANQRPSRACLRQLAEKQAALREKGITVLAVQSVAIAEVDFKKWQTSTPFPFPVGCLREKSAKTRWLERVNSLPSCILAEATHKIIADNIGMGDLEEVLSRLPE